MSSPAPPSSSDRYRHRPATRHCHRHRTFHRRPLLQRLVIAGHRRQESQYLNHLEAHHSLLHQGPYLHRLRHSQDHRRHRRPTHPIPGHRSAHRSPHPRITHRCRLPHQTDRPPLPQQSHHFLFRRTLRRSPPHRANDRSPPHHTAHRRRHRRSTYHRHHGRTEHHPRRPLPANHHLPGRTDFVIITGQLIIARSAEQHIVSRITKQLIVARTTREKIIARCHRDQRVNPCSMSPIRTSLPEPPSSVSSPPSPLR